MTIEDFIKECSASSARHGEQRGREAAAVAPLTGIEADYILCDAGQVSATVKLFLWDEHADQAPAIVKDVLRRLRAPRADKLFMPDSGKMQYVIQAHNLKVVVEAVPTKCKVKVIEESVEIPARTEVKRKFVIENPAECFAEQPEEVAGPKLVTTEAAA